MFITSFEEQNITYRSCSNFRIHLSFTLQGLKINRGRCGFSTGDFYSKMPVQMNYSSTVKYLLKCKGDQVLEAELMTDLGSFNITF